MCRGWHGGSEYGSSEVQPAGDEPGCVEAAREAAVWGCERCRLCVSVSAGAEGV